MTTPDPRLQPEALEAASRWFVRLSAGDVSARERAAWQNWRGADTANEYAWQQVEQVTRKFEAADISPALGLNVLTSPASPSRRKALQHIALLCVLGGVGTIGYRALTGEAEYATAKGEQRTLVLQDGSRVILNTDSAIDVVFTEAERRIILRSGEMYIETAQEKQRTFRPLIAQSIHGSVTALGTRFTLRSDAQWSYVSLFEGALDIRTQADAQANLRLDAGRQTRFNKTKIASPTRLLTTAPYWLNGILLIDNMPLLEFIEELSRYRPGRMTCDTRLAHLRISGAFPLGNTDAILNSIAASFPIEIQTFTRYWVKVIPR